MGILLPYGGLRCLTAATKLHVIVQRQQPTDLLYSVWNSKISDNLTPKIINIIKPNIGYNYDAYGNSYYYMIGSRVHIHIGINRLTENQNNTITTLPENFRPNSPVASSGISDKIYTHNGITFIFFLSDQKNMPGCKYRKQRCGCSIHGLIIILDLYSIEMPRYMLHPTLLTY